MKQTSTLLLGLLAFGSTSLAQSLPFSGARPNQLLSPAIAKVAAKPSFVGTSGKLTTTTSRPSRSVTYEWDATTNRWTKGVLRTYAYSPGQVFPSEVTLADSASGEVLGRRLITRFDDGRFSEQINQDATNGTFRNQSRLSWKYDSRGFETEYVEQEWVNNTWITKEGYRRLTTYNAAGVLTELIFQDLDNGTFVNSGRNTYTLDASGRWSEVLKQDWHNGVWNTNGRIHNIVWHDWDARLPSSQEGQEWMSSTMSWRDNERITSTYGPNGSYTDITETTLPAGGWENSARFSETFDSHQYSEGYVQEQWKNNAWQQFSGNQHIARYTPDGALRRYLTKDYDTDLGRYVNSELENYTNFITITLSTNQALEAGSSLYPNPSTGLITLHVNGLREQRTVPAEVVNTLGQVVQKLVLHPQQGTIEQRLDLGHLPAGPYLVRLQCAEGAFVKRLIKQ